MVRRRAWRVASLGVVIAAGGFGGSASSHGSGAGSDVPDTGGSPKCSEAMSMETLATCGGFVPLKLEVEIAWTVEGPKTDWLAGLGEDKVGVSVSRAYQGPNDQIYTVEDATTLLEKKLAGINASTQSVAPEDAWVKQLLHIWTLQPTWVPPLEEAWGALDPSLTSNTTVLVTVEVGSTVITSDKGQ